MSAMTPKVCSSRRMTLQKMRMKGKEALGQPPGAGFPEMPAVIEVGEVFHHRGAGQAADPKGVEQEQQHKTQAAEAAEKGLGMGGGNGEDAPSRAAVEDVGVGGAAGQKPRPGSEELFPEKLDVVGVVAGDHLPRFLFKPAEGRNAPAVAVKNGRLGGRGGARKARLVLAQSGAVFQEALDVGQVAQGHGFLQVGIGQAVELDADESPFGIGAQAGPPFLSEGKILDVEVNPKQTVELGGPIHHGFPET